MKGCVYTMIKKNKTISLDLDVIYGLQNVKNASKVINDYLRGYLKLEDPEETSTAVMEEEYNIKMAQALKLKAQIEENKKEESKWI